MLKPLRLVSAVVFISEWVLLTSDIEEGAGLLSMSPRRHFARVFPWVLHRRRRDR